MRHKHESKQSGGEDTHSTSVASRLAQNDNCVISESFLLDLLNAVKRDSGSTFAQNGFQFPDFDGSLWPLYDLIIIFSTQ